MGFRAAGFPPANFTSSRIAAISTIAGPHVVSCIKIRCGIMEISSRFDSVVCHDVIASTMAEILFTEV